MNKRVVIAIVAVLVLIAGLFAFIPRGSDEPVAQPTNPDASNSAGSQVDINETGITTPPEPQPAIDFSKIQKGEKPPQFVVVSFDGGVENKTGIMQHYLDLAQRTDSRFSFFLSGVYLLPDNKMRLKYDPPNHPRGSSAIGFGDPEIMETRINTLAEAYRAGHEVGTHYNGHFCGSNGVQAWNKADWTSEINQFNDILNNWRAYNPQAASAGPLPFNATVVKGGRTPCLEGQRSAMYSAFKDAGYLYDTSNSGTLKWPQKTKNGLWDIPLQAIVIPGLGNQGVLSMDYNFLVNQNNGNQQGSQEKCNQVREQSLAAYKKALKDVYSGNRAPLILGNHMNNWMCNAYTEALTEFVEETHKEKPDVRFISTLDLVTWLQEQDPEVVKELMARPTQAQ
ncbi:MAG: hypothetical protein WAS05_07555 [Candidatus Nanopelagicales bacterium]